VTDEPADRERATTWPCRTHWVCSVPATAARVSLLGRLTAWRGGRGRLADQTGELEFSCPTVPDAPVMAGDIVAVSGPVRQHVLLADALDMLVPGPGALVPGSDWRRFSDHNRLRTRKLEIRGQVLSRIRGFFTERGFVEVETPQFVTGTGQESYVEFFETEFCTKGCRVPGVLIPSPEHHMKRLLGGGLERIFQMARCFRNGECSPIHNPEFTMLEWYRAYATYDEVISDVEVLVREVVTHVRGAPVVVLDDRKIDLSTPWPRLSVEDAFRRYAGVDLAVCGDAAALRRAAKESGCRSITEEDSFEDSFHKLLIERVEPGLRSLGACFLMDYPLALGALARRKPGRPELAERAEAYVGGLEIANGFGELNDPVEQLRRFRREAARRRETGMEPVPLDAEFLAMLECGMPPAAGMALGVDRLVMLCADASCLDEVIAFPFSPSRRS